MRWASTLAGSLLALLVFAGPPPAEARVVRFAVVAGQNEGASSRPWLRYAERDAARVASLLVELGGFEPGRVRVVLASSPARLLEQLGEVAAQVAALQGPDVSTLVVVYFSGHADGLALEFGAGRLGFSEFRAAVDAIPATFTIAIVDSCQSGGLVAAKGGTPGPDFDLTLIEALEASGSAVMTSSSASERAQESDELAGSFFTHHLVSGLRGAADVNDDRRVTLAEAYRYAYQRTVVETSRTMGGPQHPAYEFRHAGRGEVVLTDLASGRATLRFDADLAGTFHVIDRETESVVAEVVKEAGQARRLALRTGVYTVGRREGARHDVANVVLTVDGETLLARRDFRAFDPVQAWAKGGPGRLRVALLSTYEVSTAPLAAPGVAHAGSLGVRLDLGSFTLAPRLCGSGAEVGPSTFPATWGALGFGTFAGWRVDARWVEVALGADLEARYELQRLIVGGLRGGPSGTLAGAVQAYLPVWERLFVVVGGRAGDHLVRLNDVWQQRFWWAFQVGLGVGVAAW